MGRILLRNSSEVCRTEAKASSPKAAAEKPPSTAKAHSFGPIRTYVLACVRVRIYVLLLQWRVSVAFVSIRPPFESVRLLFNGARLSDIISGCASPSVMAMAIVRRMAMTR